MMKYEWALFVLWERKLGVYQTALLDGTHIVIVLIHCSVLLIERHDGGIEF
jgi:hypothetical protein